MIIYNPHLYFISKTVDFLIEQISQMHPLEVKSIKHLFYSNNVMFYHVKLFVKHFCLFGLNLLLAKFCYNI